MCIIEANRVNKYFVELKNHVKIHKQTLHYITLHGKSIRIHSRRPARHQRVAPPCKYAP
jgi:hypothetical protein